MKSGQVRQHEAQEIEEHSIERQSDNQQNDCQRQAPLAKRSVIVDVVFDALGDCINEAAVNRLRLIGVGHHQGAVRLGHSLLP